MNNLYVLDRYTNKNLKIDNVNKEILEWVKYWDKISYEVDGRKSVGTNLGHEINCQKNAKFIQKLEWDDLEFFKEQNKFALKLFPEFKKDFKKEFPSSTPITAKYHIYADQLYLYFYSEERYIFTEFAKKFRNKIWKNIFLFQVWARDMIRISPATDDIPWCNWINLCCKSHRELPSIEMENIILQNLEWRDIERLKGRCGKLKCCLIYELDLYKEECEKYPKRWERVTCKNADNCWITSSFNIITREVVIKTNEWWIVRVPIEQIQKK